MVTKEAQGAKSNCVAKIVSPPRRNGDSIKAVCQFNGKCLPFSSTAVFIFSLRNLTDGTSKGFTKFKQRNYALIELNCCNVATIIYCN